MPTRREFSIGLGASLLAGPAVAETARQVALLFAAPWPGEAFLADDMALMQAGLRARGLRSSDVISVPAAVDRPTLMRQLEAVKTRVAGWSTGQVLLYYNGHGMYGPPAGGRPEPGLQLGPNRSEQTSFVLWRELFAALAVPAGVRVLLLPDCCHTNLLSGRMPAGATAFIMKSEPQDALSCRTGTALLGPKRGRHGVVSYYAGTTVSTSETAGQWLSSMNAAAEADIAAGILQPLRRVPLMVEGDQSLRVPGRRPIAEPGTDP
jgi:hypothetical protein